MGVSYCFNPSCSKPLNPGDAKFCLTCGAKLLVSERYRAVSIMGQGGFGRTLRGIDELLPSHPACAIKQFMPMVWGELSETSDKAFDLFQQEAQRLDQLGQHPQIPRLLAHVCQDQHWYLVQEFIDGATLSQALTEVGSFQEAQIWQLLADLLPVLVYLQQQQVIHRDIKPDNILRRHPDQTLVLVDFGAAKFATTTRLAQTGTMISSAGYTAPEQLLGRAVHASDLYSLGATCVHLLTGIPAYELYDSDEGTWGWRQKLPTPISAGLTQFLHKLLQPPLKHRYASAAEALAEVQALMPPPQKNARQTAPAPQPQPQATPPPSPNPSVSADLQWHCVRVLANSAPVIGVGFTEKLGVIPTSETLVIVSQTGAIKLWELTSKQLQTALGEHAGALQAMVLTPDQPLLICGSASGRLSFWQLATGQLCASVSTGDQGIQALGLSHHQQILAAGSNRHLQLWHLQNHRSLAQISAEAPIGALIFSPEDEWLLGGGQDGKLRVWSLPNAQESSLTLQQRLFWQVGPIYDLAFSPDGEVLVAGGQDGYIKFWRVNRSDPLQVLFKGNQAIHSLRFSPQGDILVAGFGDGTLRFWDWPTGNLFTSSKEHTAAVTCLCFSHDARLLASGSQDHTVRLWRSDG